MTGVKRRTGHFSSEAARDSTPCSAVAVPMMASMHDWKPTDSTGRHRRAIRPVDGSTTLVEAGKLSIVNTVARSRELSPFGVCGSDPSEPMFSSVVARCLPAFWLGAQLAGGERGVVVQ
jgi:hypothetical protein